MNVYFEKFWGHGVALFGPDGDINSSRKFLYKLDPRGRVFVHMADTVEEVSRYPHVSKFIEKSFSAYSIECFAIVHKACEEIPFLTAHVFFDHCIESQDVVTALGTAPKSKLIRKVGTYAFSEFQESLEEYA